MGLQVCCFRGREVLIPRPRVLVKVPRLFDAPSPLGHRVFFGLTKQVERNGIGLDQGYADF